MVCRLNIGYVEDKGCVGNVAQNGGWSYIHSGLIEVSLSISLSIYLSIYLSHSFSLSLYLSISLSIYQSLSLSIYLSMYIIIQRKVRYIISKDLAHHMCSFCRNSLIYCNESKFESQLLLWSKKGKPLAQCAFGTLYNDGEYVTKNIDKSIY